MLQRAVSSLLANTPTHSGGPFFPSCLMFLELLSARCSFASAADSVRSLETEVLTTRSSCKSNQLIGSLSVRTNLTTQSEETNTNTQPLPSLGLSTELCMCPSVGPCFGLRWARSCAKMAALNRVLVLEQLFGSVATPPRCCIGARIS